MSVPPYAPPSVGPAGLVVNTYQSILQDNIAAFLNIYGVNQYVGPDSAIYQLLSIISLKQADQNAALQLCYNQSSPQTAVGAGLDRVAKMNGIARAPFTYSTCSVICTGTPSFVINNGFAQDQNGNLWALPNPTPITGGSVTVTATCTTPGNVAAEPGDINIIAMPVSGWSGVTNAVAATPGDPVEADSKLRARQSISVALPGLTPIGSTLAAVLATLGVTRCAPGYPTSGGPGTSIENPTGATDSWGNPAHSISLVVEGGTDAAVGLSIYLKKTIGCLTNGTTSTVVADPNTGYMETISFYRPTYLPIFVLMYLHGYGNTPNTATLAAVQAAVVAYINDLEIGETVPISAVSYEAMAINSTLITPGFGVQSLLLGIAAAQTTATVTIGVNTIVVASAAGIVLGQFAVGLGLFPGATVTLITGTIITLSGNSTANGSAIPVTFATMAATDVVMPNYYYSAQGAPVDVFVGTV